MPKRPKTPDSGPEHIKILAVHYPYPAQANLEQVGEQADFISWIVGCLGDDRLLEAIAWKPRTPNVVLVYVSKDLVDWRKILGEHRWSEVFRPNHVHASDLHRHSRVFYATFSTHRDAEKAGWKIKYLTTDFVKETVTDICIKPYPQTHWCPTPGLDITNESWIRELPLSLFPDKPPPTPKVVVGSTAWKSGNGAKLGQGNNSTGRGAAPARGAWAKPITTTARTNPLPASSSSLAGSTVVASGVPSARTFHAWTISGAPTARSVVSSDSGRSPPSTTAWGRSTDSTATLADPYAFYDDEDDEYPLSSVTDSLATTTLFSTTPQKLTEDDTHHTTAEAQVAPEDTGEENLWAAAEKQKSEDPMELAKCPIHQKLCNPNVCSVIEPHCRSLGLNYRELKAKSKGPSNVYTLERERQATEQEKPKPRPRGDRNRRHNPAADLW